MVTIIKSLPKKAGKAKINWDSVDEPIREGKDIILPLQDTVYLPLAKGEQFLFKSFEHESYRAPRENYWFGGTDEEPFLVQIEKDAFNTFTNNGEEAFYRSIKPFFVDFLEKILNIEAERQGDIFAVPIGERKNKGIQSFLTQSYISREYPKLELKKNQNSLSLFGTRHALNGYVLGEQHPGGEVTSPHFKPFLLTNSLEERSVLGTGIIKAPDHEVLDLNKEFIYFMAQTRYLVNPKEAD
ncbi:hypothetical protein KAT80_01480 [Candidatus Pacearchaeota archaeon]|nr:hypothetical protein [Candidatus Pacearchaeota archaeon]